MFAKILIANRGEIACRIIRTARDRGVRTVAVYSDADADALHVAMADEAHHIGSPAARDSYLRGDRIIAAALATGAEAIHPGYGFLSENADFAEQCGGAGVVFIGPPPEAIRAMGSKIAAKALMEAAGVPVTPGYHGTAQDPGLLRHAAEGIGFPLLVKASSGGGGRGMRVVRSRQDLDEALISAAREATAAFGDGSLLLERYLERARHIEVQVFADSQGTIVHLFERDCSIQRRHQKIIEEAPAPGIGAGLRAELGETAVRAARVVGYVGAGTVEFLLAPDGAFYFMEMNTRLQVEHPVTEMITGLDLVDWQLRVACGEPLPLRQEDLAINGHAVEVRIYAEDPDRDFLPAAGPLRHLRFPDETGHVRIDGGVRQGDSVGTFYDPMIAKLIVWDATRSSALMRLRAALAETQIVGPQTNVAFLLNLTALPAFNAGELQTRFIDDHRRDVFPERTPMSARFLALASLDVLLRRDAEARAAAARSADPHSPWHATSGWRLNDDNHHVLTFRCGESSIDVIVHFRASGLVLEIPGESAPVAASGAFDPSGDLLATLDGVRLRATVVHYQDALTILLGGEARRLEPVDPAARAETQEATGGGLTAPMPGKVIAVGARAGDAVARGATLIVLEAMKTEHAITAPADGIVAAVHYDVGEQVEEGAELVTFQQDDAGAAEE